MLETELKNLHHSPHISTLENVQFLPKNADFFLKKIKFQQKIVDSGIVKYTF